MPCPTAVVIRAVCVPLGVDVVGGGPPARSLYQLTHSKEQSVHAPYPHHDPHPGGAATLLRTMIHLHGRGSRAVRASQPNRHGTTLRNRTPRSDCSVFPYSKLHAPCTSHEAAPLSLVVTPSLLSLRDVESGSTRDGVKYRRRATASRQNMHTTQPRDAPPLITLNRSRPSRNHTSPSRSTRRRSRSRHRHRRAAS